MTAWMWLLVFVPLWFSLGFLAGCWFSAGGQRCGTIDLTGMERRERSVDDPIGTERW